MNKLFGTKKFFFQVLFSVFSVFLFCFFSQEVKAVGLTYYIDAVNGNDASDGQTINTPWKSLSKVNSTVFKPGEKILFKAGCTWTGGLTPQGSGAAGSPIVIDKYGEGNKPIIDGKGTVENVIHFINQQYWEVHNLEITNYGTTTSMRRAIRVDADDMGVVNHFHFTNLYIHDINGDLTNKLNGGIMVYAGGTTVPTKYNDILVDKCSFLRIDRSAVKIVVSKWCDRTAAPAKWYPSTNVVISNNTIDDIGGDGVTVRDTDGARIEYNVAKDCNKRTLNVTSKWNVAFWPFQADNTIIQYNEAYLTRTLYDGQGFDCDYLCNGTIMQYNYSHDNEGGFMLIMNNNNYNNDVIIRYNISQNDATRTFQFNTGIAKNIQIYNNTIYTSAAVKPQIFNIGSAGTYNTFYAYNNIFNMNGGTQGAITYGVFDSNVYYPIAAVAKDTKAITTNPQLVNAGSGSIGRNTLGGYKLKATSPCIDTGKTITNNGGKDFLGNTAVYGNGITDRGAIEFQGSPVYPLPPATTSEVFNDNFQNGLGNWIQEMGAWSIVDDGTKMLQGPTGGRISAGNTAWTNYVLHTTLKPVSFSSGGTVQVSFRYTNNDNRYFVVLNSNNTISVNKRVNAIQSTLVSKSFTVTTGKTYDMYVRVNGSNIDVYVDDVLQLSTTDSSLASGKIAFVDYQATARFGATTVTSIN